jgi:hypothetical protein
LRWRRAAAARRSITARTTLLPPGSQQQSGSAAALAALGSLGGWPAAGAQDAGRALRRAAEERQRRCARSTSASA